MWVEADPRTFERGQCIAVKYDQHGRLIEGVFSHAVDHGTGRCYFYFRTRNTGLMGASNQRRFYRWEGDKPEDSHNHVLSKDCPCGPTTLINESRIRLNKPDPQEKGKRLHQHVGKLIDEQKNEPPQLVTSVTVGRQLYALRPGDHLRVWWEDGALWSELVQERTK